MSCQTVIVQTQRDNFYQDPTALGISFLVAFLIALIVGLIFWWMKGLSLIKLDNIAQQYRTFHNDEENKENPLLKTDALDEEEKVGDDFRKLKFTSLQGKYAKDGMQSFAWIFLDPVRESHVTKLFHDTLWSIHARHVTMNQNFFRVFATLLRIALPRYLRERRIKLDEEDLNEFFDSMNHNFHEFAEGLRMKYTMAYQATLDKKKKKSLKVDINKNAFQREELSAFFHQLQILLVTRAKLSDDQADECVKEVETHLGSHFSQYFQNMEDEDWVRTRVMKRYERILRPFWMEVATDSEIIQAVDMKAVVSTNKLGETMEKEIQSAFDEIRKEWNEDLHSHILRWTATRQRSIAELLSKQEDVWENLVHKVSKQDSMEDIISVILSLEKKQQKKYDEAVDELDQAEMRVVVDVARKHVNVKKSGLLEIKNRFLGAEKPATPRLHSRDKKRQITADSMFDYLRQENEDARKRSQLIQQWLHKRFSDISHHYLNVMSNLAEDLKKKTALLVQYKTSHIEAEFFLSHSMAWLQRVCHVADHQAKLAALREKKSQILLCLAPDVEKAGNKSVTNIDKAITKKETKGLKFETEWQDWYNDILHHKVQKCLKLIRASMAETFGYCLMKQVQARITISLEENLLQELERHVKESILESRESDLPRAAMSQCLQSHYNEVTFALEQLHRDIRERLADIQSGQHYAEEKKLRDAMESLKRLHQSIRFELKKCTHRTNETFIDKVLDHQLGAVADLVRRECENEIDGEGVEAIQELVLHLHSSTLKSRQELVANLFALMEYSDKEISDTLKSAREKVGVSKREGIRFQKEFIRLVEVGRREGHRDEVDRTESLRKHHTRRDDKVSRQNERDKRNSLAGRVARSYSSSPRRKQSDSDNDDSENAAHYGRSRSSGGRYH